MLEQSCDECLMSAWQAYHSWSILLSQFDQSGHQRIIELRMTTDFSLFVWCLTISERNVIIPITVVCPSTIWCFATRVCIRNVSSLTDKTVCVLVLVKLSLAIIISYSDHEDQIFEILSRLLISRFLLYSIFISLV